MSAPGAQTRSQPITFDGMRGQLHACVIGASGGIGNAIVEALGASPQVARLYCAARSPITLAGALHGHQRIHRLSLDLTDETSIETAARTIAGETDGLDLVFVATGILHDARLQPEKRLRQLSAANLGQSLAVNAIGPALVAKHFLPLLRRTEKSIFAALSARVGSIEDNRIGGWYGYRASKAALNMLLRTAAIELARTHPQAVCVGLHPGTVDSALSAPFQRGVPPEQLFTPAFSATRLLHVVASLDAEDTGQLFAWDGQRIPF